MQNPFYEEWSTPYGVPDFEAIRTEHYMPAFQEAMRRQKAEVAAIVANPVPPTFANTVEALERSGGMLARVSGVFFNLAESNHSDEMERIAEEVTPLLSAHHDDISLNAELFARVKVVYERRQQEALEPEQQRLLEETYKSFVRHGAGIPNDKQARLREMNEQIASLELRFGNNVLRATNEYALVVDRAQLSGLPESQCAAAVQLAQEAGDAEGSYRFTLQMPSWEPFMCYVANRELRRQMWEAYTLRCTSGVNDNRLVIDQLVNLRRERAQLLGYENHAAYVLDDCMARTPQAVYNCLLRLWQPALRKAKEECAALSDMLHEEFPATEELQPYDWRYYSEQLRRRLYSIDEEQLRTYFPLERVREGAFMVANRLYGLNFRRNDALPTYDKEAEAYEVVENGRVRAVLYMDFFPRASKSSGAWMTNFEEQYVDAQGRNHVPVIQVVCNFTRPAADRPSLLSFDEAQTLFHEFGHALHSILSNCRYRSLSGTNVPRDFVELPSQLMENWCRHRHVLKEYARHYATDEAIPDALVEKLQAATTYGQGFANTELLAASLLDMDFHTLVSPKAVDLPRFEDEAMERIGLIPQIVSRYRSPYFLHIFSTGYDAGYYSYTWTAILDADAFEAFCESGDLYNPLLAQRFRRILEHGNTTDLMALYRDFRGREPSVDALLRNRGLA
ncbi:MAG: M3 family metallopeptidase [Bacteroidales bacterium]|nr:M3 family metallopeptidase [Bacteroidales bacterium]